MTGEPEQVSSLYSKLAAVMRDIGYVEKRGHNSFHNYDYVTEADLVDAVRSKLAARNVILIPSLSGIDERGVTNAKGKESTITTVRVAFTFCDGDSGQTHTAEWAGSGDDPADKGLYKAYTGAVKYFLMKSFLIPTGDDPEADSGTDERSSGGQSSRPAQTRDVKRTNQSDLEAPDVWFDDVEARMRNLGFKGKDVRAGLSATCITVPANVSSWRHFFGTLTEGERLVFGMWLADEEAKGTPLEQEPA